MSHKHAAIKEKCLRYMSESEFQEVYSFIQSRLAVGSKELTTEELSAKFGEKNKDIVFQIEQLVYLSSILDKGQNTTTDAAAKKSTVASPVTVRTKPTSATPKSKPTSAGSATSTRSKKK